jgi:hypothetical protein
VPSFLSLKLRYTLIFNLPSCAVYVLELSAHARLLPGPNALLVPPRESRIGDILSIPDDSNELPTGGCMRALAYISADLSSRGMRTPLGVASSAGVNKFARVVHRVRRFVPAELEDYDSFSRCNEERDLNDKEWAYPELLWVIVSGCERVQKWTGRNLLSYPNSKHNGLAQASRHGQTRSCCCPALVSSLDKSSPIKWIRT